MTPNELRRLFPNASRSTLEANSHVSHPGAEPHPASALVKADEGKEKGMDRVIVRFIGYRVRPLDPDAFAGSIKGILDGVRRCGLLRDDSFYAIRLETEQHRVKTFAEERTEIEIIYPR